MTRRAGGQQPVFMDFLSGGMIFGKTPAEIRQAVRGVNSKAEGYTIWPENTYDNKNTPF